MGFLFSLKKEQNLVFFQKTKNNRFFKKPKKHVGWVFEKKRVFLNPALGTWENAFFKMKSTRQTKEPTTSANHYFHNSTLRILILFHYGRHATNFISSAQPAFLEEAFAIRFYKTSIS